MNPIAHDICLFVYFFSFLTSSLTVVKGFAKLVSLSFFFLVFFFFCLFVSFFLFHEKLAFVLFPLRFTVRPGNVNMIIKGPGTIGDVLERKVFHRDEGRGHRGTRR